MNIIKCNGDCFNCKVPVEKCKGQPSNSKSAYKPMSKRKKKNTYGTLPASLPTTRPKSYKPSRAKYDD